MTEEAWKVFAELMDILKERFDDQEKRIKVLEEQIKCLTTKL
jgi:chaperonin cofactor prefoldin